MSCERYNEDKDMFPVLKHLNKVKQQKKIQSARNGTKDW